MKKIISVVLAVAILCMGIPFQAVMASDTDILYNTQRTDFDISEANGANAKMFMLLNGEDYNKGTDYTYPKDYYLGLDYLGYLYFDSDNYSRPTGTSVDKLYTPYNSVTGALIYTIDGTDNNNDTNNTVNFTTKNEKLYWNINDVDYLINPNEKAIKLYKNVKTDNISDAELATRFNSLNQVTFDVTDGNYTQIGFLAACGNTRTLSVTLVYDDQDGSKTETTKMSGTDSNAKGQSKGAVYFQDVNTHAHSNRKRTFKPYTVPVDSSRVLKEVKLKSNDRRDEIVIISAWGVAVSSEMLIEELLDSTDENYNPEEEISKIEKIEAKLVEEGRTVKDLNEEALEKLNKAKAQILSYIAQNLPEEATKENLEDVLTEIANVENTASDYGIEIPADVKTQIDSLKTQIDAINAELAAAKLEKWEYEDISIQSGANSKMFVKHEDNIKIQYTDMLTQEYNYIKDYINIEEYGKVVVWGNKTEGAENYNANATPWAHSPIQYSFEKTGGSYAQYIPLDTESKWNITVGEETLKYFIDTENGKAIKLKKVGDKEIVNYSDEQKAELNSMLTASVDIDKKCYKEIKLLAGAVNNQDANIDVVITYTDGTKDTPVPVTVTKQSLGTTSSVGYVNAGGSRYFKTITINPNAAKPVEKLTFTLKTSNRDVVILSMIGKTSTVRDLIENMSTDVTAENYLTQKALIEKIDAENINLAIIGGVLYEKYNTLKNNVNNFKAFEITSIEKSGSDVTVSYNNITGADITGTLIVAQYKDATENELVKVQTLDVTLKNNETLWQSAVETVEGTTVKFFLWKNLLNFFG